MFACRKAVARVPPPQLLPEAGGIGPGLRHPAEPGTVPHRPSPHPLSPDGSISASAGSFASTASSPNIFLCHLNCCSAVSLQPPPAAAAADSCGSDPWGRDSPTASDGAQPLSPALPSGRSPRPCGAERRLRAADERTQSVLLRTFRKGRGGEGTTRPPLRGPAKAPGGKKKKKNERKKKKKKALCSHRRRLKRLRETLRRPPAAPRFHVTAQVCCHRAVFIQRINKSERN